MGLTTIVGQKPHSGMQQMGETRDPMAVDCWEDAHRIAVNYSKMFGQDLWILFAAKPHTSIENGIVMGWEVCVKRPPAPMLGVMVFQWSYKDQILTVDPLSLPYDVPISESEMSTSAKDFVPSLCDAAKKSNAIVLA